MWNICLFKSIELGKNDEVIVQIAFIATLNAVILAGATILCDVDEKNLSIDLDKVEKNYKKTKAIIPVHLYGHCCELDKL